MSDETPLPPPIPALIPDGLGSPNAAKMDLSADLSALAQQAARYAARASGPGTRAAYGSAWRAYSAWCAGIGREPLSGDPGLVALYLTKRAEDGLAVSSLQVARAAIRAAHRLAGVPLDLGDARLGLVMEGIARSRAGRSKRQAAPAVPDLLRRLLAALPAPNSPPLAAPALAARHRAMLLIGFGAALRRSEIVGLAIDDITVIDGRGLSVLIRQSKTDQRGRGRTLAIWANHRDPEFCPLAAYEGWMRFRNTGKGTNPSPALTDDRATADNGIAAPLFCGVAPSGALTGIAMSDKIVARLMKQACLLAGIDPGRFSGHSLRRGLLTTAGDLQLPLIDLMRQSRHKSVETALSYIEAGEAWRNNITEAVFRPGPKQHNRSSR